MLSARPALDALLDKPEAFHRAHIVQTDDEVVMYSDPQRLERVDQRIGVIDVAGRWSWIASWMIVTEADRYSADIQSALRDFAGVNRAKINGSIENLIADQAVLLVQVQHPQLLLGAPAQFGDEIIAHEAIARHQIALMNLLGHQDF